MFNSWKRFIFIFLPSIKDVSWIFHLKECTFSAKILIKTQIHTAYLKNTFKCIRRADGKKKYRPGCEKPFRSLSSGLWTQFLHVKRKWAMKSRQQQEKHWWWSCWRREKNSKSEHGWRAGAKIWNVHYSWQIFTLAVCWFLIFLHFMPRSHSILPPLLSYCLGATM